MLQVQEVATRLRDNGYKVTPQRLAVYEALAKTKAHPCADTLYKELRITYPTMSLATVYKSLSILCSIGLAHERSSTHSLHEMWPRRRCPHDGYEALDSSGDRSHRLSSDRSSAVFLRGLPKLCEERK